MRFSLIQQVSILTIGLLLNTSVSSAAYSFEGQISMIEKDYLVLNGTRFQLSNGHADQLVRLNCGSDTKFYTPGGDEITFGTVAGVGYVDRAKIYVTNGCVQTLHILEIYQ